MRYGVGLYYKKIPADFEKREYDDVENRVEPIENPFGPKVLPMSPV